MSKDPTWPRVVTKPHDSSIIALEAAKRIEDIFTQHHDGGRTQRLARVQVEVMEAMRLELIAARHERLANG